MESPESKTSVSQERLFDVASRDKVKSALAPFVEEIGIIVEASQLKDRTKREMQEFLKKFMTRFEDDDYVRRVCVSFTSDGQMMKVRSDDGVYDLDNTLRYLWSELGGFFSSLSVALNNESQKEMTEVKKAIQHSIETLE